MNQKEPLTGQKILASYKAWRKAEGYAVPATEEGQEMAWERYKKFKEGYDAAVQDIWKHLEWLHGKSKKDHNFFLWASKNVRKTFGENG